MSALYLVLAATALVLATYNLFRFRARRRGQESPGGSRVVRVVASVLVLAGAGFVTLTSSPNLGLDLEGGAQIVLETQDTDTVDANSESTDRALEVLRRRVDALGVSEPSLSRSGDRRIIVELPGVSDPREASEALGQTAQLNIHAVLGYDTSGLTPPTDAPAETPAPDAPAETPAPEATPGAAETEGAAGGAIEPATPQGDTGTDVEAAGATPPPAETPAPTETPAPETPGAEGQIVLPDESGQPLVLAQSAMTGEEIDGADALFDPQRGWLVTIDFSGSGGSTWAQLTSDAACQPEGDPRRRIAIVLDNEVISSPNVTSGVPCGVGIRGGQTEITGDFDEEEAKDLAALIEGGALPVPVEVIEQRVIGPTLGDEAIEASAWAAIIGMALTAVFIAVTYRLIGVMAIMALIGYALMSYAALSALGATLTLPGLAGFVLAIGMAVDANVLIFERAREDFVDGRTKSLRGAVRSGFKNALSAIADSNITTLLAAALLFFLASGPVRGFGVTLTIGVLASLLSALVLSRVLCEWLADRTWMRNHPNASGLAKHGRVRLWLRRRNPNLMARPARWLIVSALAVVIAGSGIFLRGLEYGIEFTGGRLVEVSTTEQLDVDDARTVVADAGFPTAIVQESGDDDITVRASDMSDDEAAAVIEALGDAGGGSELIRDELVGPSLGDELRRNALIALGVALIAQLTYLAIRFRWTFSTGAVVALFQNVIITVGIFAWIGKPLDGMFLAAILTIIGYTVNDSVVVFDRIRETWTRKEDEDFAQVTNTAILNTLPRSVNTGVSTLFILLSLLFLGGDSLSDFALALVLGIVIGTYSSNFTASPLAVVLERKKPAPPPEPKKADKRDREDPNYGAVV
ncbi:protein translocase subunit SecD [Jiangella gansuensis]|uniref:protein translocase subunit SecD n=1 Tax=Jiangella gansuensis TaxID=281473 RepID=UPI0012FA8BF0|nr:protein translocase subunit SecD [Jiangella gansuensis]